MALSNRPSDGDLKDMYGNRESNGEDYQMAMALSMQEHEHEKVLPNTQNDEQFARALNASQMQEQKLIQKVKNPCELCGQENQTNVGICRVCRSKNLSRKRRM